jgi:TfdA family taurine catabolism dioxygenase TauD
MADIIAPAKLISNIRDVWAGLAPDEESLHDPATQGALRARLESTLGKSWQSFLGNVLGQLATAPYSVIVRGNGADQARCLLVALALGAGEMVNPYRERVPSVGLVQEIVAKGSRSPDLVWLWHTDSANWPRPNDYSALACLRAAPSGGATETLSLETMRASPAWRNDELRPLWETDFEWEIDRFLGGGMLRVPSFTAHGLRFRRELMRDAGPADYQRAVDAFGMLADATPPDVCALLRPGDVLIFDNSRVMHRSGRVDDPRRERLLLRVKIARTAVQDRSANGHDLPYAASAS